MRRDCVVRLGLAVVHRRWKRSQTIPGEAVEKISQPRICADNADQIKQIVRKSLCF
jgi:hypothetical protein